MKLTLIFLLGAIAAQAQLAVTVSPLKLNGQKAIVPMAMKNNFEEKIESARAAVFLLDEKGKRLGQETRWVIGGSTARLGLPAGATNAFYFVVTASQPITTTNLSAQVVFSRVILEGGKLADVRKDVRINEPLK